MKYLGTITDNKDLVTKEYVDSHAGGSGTVTSISAGTGLTTSDGNAITTSGTVKAKLNSETSIGTIGSTSKLYALGVDSNGELCTKVSWSDIQTRSSDAGVERTLYIVGDTSDTDHTGGLSKQSSFSFSLSSNSVANGYTILNIGNSTDSASTGAKEGSLRIYGSSTSYTDIKVGASTTAKTISFPDADGTVALTSDVTDEKVLCNVISDGSGSGYPILGKPGNAATRDIDTAGFKYAYNLPAAGTTGKSTLTLGNSKATTSAKNQRGIIELFGTGTKAVELSAGNITAKRSIEFPNKAGTVALTSDIPSSSGTVTSISAGIGLTTASGSDITTSGTVKAKLANETPISSSSVDQYPLGVDSNGFLSTEVPCVPKNQMIFTLITDSVAGIGIVLSYDDGSDIYPITWNELDTIWQDYCHVRLFDADCYSGDGIFAEAELQGMFDENGYYYADFGTVGASRYPLMFKTDDPMYGDLTFVMPI